MGKDKQLFEKPIWNALAQVADFAILNVLWIFCSLPIVTLGAATTALYDCMIKIIGQRDQGIAAMFFHSFRSNLKQGAVLTLVSAISGFFLLCDLRFFGMLDGLVFKLAFAVFAILGVFWVITVSYVFPILAQFDNTVIGHIRSAFLVGLMNLKRTIPIVILNMVPISIFLFAPGVFLICMPIWLLCGASLIAFFNSKMLVPIFNTYINDNEMNVSENKG